MTLFPATIAFVIPALLQRPITTPTATDSLAATAFQGLSTSSFSKTSIKTTALELSKTPMQMPPLNPRDLEKLNIDSRDIRARMGNIDGLTKHQLIGNSQIGWCACDNAPTDKRLALIDKIVDRASQADCKDIEITDVGSGRLLQAYLMTDQLLSLDCPSITLNLIDPFYPETLCQTYTLDKDFCAPNHLALFNPNFDEDIAAPPPSVSEGFSIAALEYLDHLKTMSAATSVPKKSIKVRILNSADLLPALREKDTTPDQHQIILTDPGEPALSKSAHFHMLGAGSKDALPHQDRVLVFLERTPLKNAPVENARVQDKAQEHCIQNQPEPKQGILYIQCDMYDDIAAKDKAFLQAILALKQPTRSQIKDLFNEHYADAHLYDDATQSFHQLLDAMPEAQGLKLANRDIVENPKLQQQQKLPLDEYFKQSGTLLGKKISAGFRTVPFTYIEA